MGFFNVFFKIILSSGHPYYGIKHMGVKSLSRFGAINKSLPIRESCEYHSTVVIHKEISKSRCWHFNRRIRYTSYFSILVVLVSFLFGLHYYENQVMVLILRVNIFRQFFECFLFLEIGNAEIKLKFMNHLNFEFCTFIKVG